MYKHWRAQDILEASCGHELTITINVADPDPK